MSTVTVCVPVFEGGEFLEKTMAAIRSQTHADLRVLMSVDLSEDNSLSICRRMQASEPRITVFAQDRKLGFVENVNFLVRRAETEFFCVTPQDDLLAPDYLESLLRPLRERPGAALAYSDLRRSDGEPIQFQASLLGDTGERILRFLVWQQNFVEWRGVVRSAYVDESFPFVAGENVDQAFPLKLGIRGELVRVPRPLYFKTYHARSATAHQRADATGRLENIADSFDGCFSCYQLAAGALPDPSFREMTRVALLLRCLNIAERSWPPNRSEPASDAERRAFAAVLRHRDQYALFAHRALAALADPEERQPRALAILRSAALFHLALAAERHVGREEAASLMRRATELDPQLAGGDPFHRLTCERVLAG